MSDGQTGGPSHCWLSVDNWRQQGKSYSIEDSAYQRNYLRLGDFTPAIRGRRTEESVWG